MVRHQHFTAGKTGAQFERTTYLSANISSFYKYHNIFTKKSINYDDESAFFTKIEDFSPSDRSIIRSLSSIIWKHKVK